MTPEQETLLRIIIDEAQEEAVYNTLAAALEGHKPAREEYERLKRKANQQAETPVSTDRQTNTQTEAVK